MRDSPIAHTHDGWFRFHSTDGLTLEEELAMIVAEAEGRAPAIRLKEWRKDATRRAGCPDLTRKDEP